MDFGLDDKIVLVTGGSRGIGREIALSFAAEGARVAVTYHRERAEAERVAAQAADGIAVAMDLEEPATIGAAVDEVVARYGGIDVLVVNAVRWPAENAERFEDQSSSEWRAVLRANLEGAFETVHRTLPAMRSRAWGRVVFVSSEIAESGYPTVGPYAAAKAGLHGFARTLAWDLGRDGILVNVVAAGFTATDGNRRNTSQELRDRVARLVPQRRVSTAQDVARTVVWLASGANTSITGEVVRDGTSAARTSIVAVD